MKIFEFDQGSLEWHKQRVGKITMSHAKKLITKGRGGKPSQTRLTYLYDVLAEALTGEPREGYQLLDMERGTFLESYALRAVSEALGVTCKAVGFVELDNLPIGCSPDAFADGHAIVEAKCPAPRQHIKNCFADGFDEYLPQCQGNMWVTETDVCYLVSFCPAVNDFPMRIETIERDETMIETIAESAVTGAQWLSETLKTIRSHYVPGSVQEIAMQARNAWDNVLAAHTGDVQL